MKVALTVGQISDLSALCGESSTDEVIVIQFIPKPWHNKESGEEMPCGFYAYFEDYPDEGMYGPIGAP